MDTKEYVKLQAERTIDHLAKKVDEILDDTEENGGYLSSTDVHTLKNAWCAINAAKEAWKVMHEAAK